MKFSVLLPTRNRLDLLRYAVETVRRQDHSGWEVIVSDNDSAEDVAGFVRGLGDDRVKYFRTDRFVPVTDNWNNALSKSTGDYVIMLGDDDGLMRGSLAAIAELVKRHAEPDCIYTGAFLYAYPGAIPGAPDGRLQPYGYAEFLRSAREPFLLDRTTAHAMVHHSLRFRVRFGYNMQFFVISRRAIELLERYGPFFQSPYPDYYAANALLFKSDRVLATPQPLVTIGISPKSFGFYYFNDQESKGVEFLKNLPDPDMARRLDPVILPGTNMNTSWLVAMETLATRFRDDGIPSVDHARYRLLQVLSVYRKVMARSDGAAADVAELSRRLTPSERRRLATPLSLLTKLCSPLPDRYRNGLMNRLLRATGTYPAFDPPAIPGRYRTILDVFDAIDPRTWRP